jgi:hypothetical protein
MMEQLPDDLLRMIIRFIPRNDTAQLIHNSELITLKYVRRYKFKVNEHYDYETRIWSELKPSHLKSVFYGDGRMIRRTAISKGQKIILKNIDIIL